MVFLKLNKQPFLVMGCPFPRLRRAAQQEEDSDSDVNPGDMVVWLNGKKIVLRNAKVNLTEKLIQMLPTITVTDVENQSRVLYEPEVIFPAPYKQPTDDEEFYEHTKRNKY